MRGKNIAGIPLRNRSNNAKKTRKYIFGYVLDISVQFIKYISGEKTKYMNM